MKTFAVALLAALAHAQEPYYYKWSPENPVAPPFEFPKNIPVPFPATNEPTGNAGYQYQYTPDQPNARPFKAPQDYTPVDFKYQYVSQPGDSFKYNYHPAPGEFDFVYTPPKDQENLSPEEINQRAGATANTVREVANLLANVNSDDIKAITGELGFGQGFDLSGVSAGINKVGDFIEDGGAAGAKIAESIGPIQPAQPAQPAQYNAQPAQYSARPVQYKAPSVPLPYAAYQSAYPAPANAQYANAYRSY
ncbi:hypothetical protein TCAL_05456 [Tigriopus californicus]|uniref:Uncharacterized protein n=1 Tax=Tigriopus californicus TaxID=6832 RepID=A0A553P836_TIGCA|nr:uncharacterized protein LOC131877694 [Tigriopus californicus]TRY73843.1 hypothetical protein TCAL_05456 [Tigriopus californicus]|eukprot:TCALIF_05456-PA protein Name:"Protein of unknown function" AED:0.30 eAED:0.30 QI:130/1/0.5/1/1/1/2/177/249